MTFRAIDPATAKIYYAEEADKPISTLNIPDGSLVIFTDSGLEDSFDAVANAWFNREQIAQTSGGKAAGLMVVAEIGKKGQAHNRERTSVTTTREKVTYTDSQDVTQITVQATDTNTAATDSNAALVLCFDAFDDPEADSWLTETDLETFDVQRHLVQVGADPVVFSFSQALSRIDFKALGAETLRVSIGGA